MAKKLAVLIVVAFLAAVAPKGSPAPPTSSMPIQVSLPPIPLSTSTPIQISLPPIPPSTSMPFYVSPPPSPLSTSTPILASPPPSLPSASLTPTIQASAPPPPSPPSTSPTIQASPPPSAPSVSPPVQASPTPSASPPIQASPPPSPPVQASPPPSPPIQASRPPPFQGLTVDYYKQSCPSAEQIISDVVRKTTTSNPGMGGGLIRLAFHDCFVQGCDGSVLLDPTSANPQPEKLGIPNRGSLRGFEVIDEAKAKLEAACPGTVSCADVVQFAARDAINFLSYGKVNFQMPAGRRDGRVSLASETLPNLPPPSFNLPQLIANFAAKGLSADDLVVLSGAHSVGNAHCSSFYDRIATPGTTNMSILLAGRLSRQYCRSKPSAGNDPMVVQDMVTPNKMDNQYFRNLLNGNVLFDSDAALLASDETTQMVFFNAYNTLQWEQRFAAAMVKMAGIELKTDTNGEIRTNCRVIN